MVNKELETLTTASDNSVLGADVEKTRGTHKE